MFFSFHFLSLHISTFCDEWEFICVLFLMSLMQFEQNWFFDIVSSLWKWIINAGLLTARGGDAPEL